MADIALGATLVPGTNIVAGKVMERMAEDSKRMSLMEHMLIQNDLYAPIETEAGDGSILISDDGAAILADWQYKIV